MWFKELNTYMPLTQKDQWIKEKHWKQKAPCGTACIVAHRIPVRFRGIQHVYGEQYRDPNFSMTTIIDVL